jgi:hypothetical protein
MSNYRLCPASPRHCCGLRALLLLAALAAALAGHAAVSLIGGQTKEFTLAPGARTEGSIELYNGGKDAPPQDVRCYQTDQVSKADGSATYGTPGMEARSNAAWITYTPHQLTVAPDEKTSVSFVIQVPNDAALSGSYWSMMMVEPSAPELPMASEGGEPGKLSVGIRTVVRYAVAIIVHINNTGERNIAFGTRAIAPEGGQLVYSQDINNTGTRDLTLITSMELFTADGAPAGRFLSGRQRVHPGGGIRARIPLAGLAPGHYQALVVTDNGDDFVVGYTEELNIL